MRTRQLLTVPIDDTNQAINGVIQLANKKSAPRFTQTDEDRVQEISRTLGIALHNNTQVATRRTKFDFLLTSRRLKRHQLEEALAAAQTHDRPVEAILMEMFGVTKRALGQAPGIFYRCAFLEASKHLEIAPDLIQGINPSYLKAKYWIPIRVTDDVVEILTNAPHDVHKQQDIRRLFPGKKITYVVGLRDDILKIVNAVSTDLASDESRTAILGQLVAEDEDDAADSLEEADENDSAIVRLVNQIITDAYNAGASDIHIEPHGEGLETVVRFREDGSCYTQFQVPPRNRQAIISRIKALAQLDIAERRKPQDGRIQFRLADRDIELRVATIPTAGTGNEGVVLHLLTAHESLSLDQLKMSPDNLRRFKQLLDKPYGARTGSGKTKALTRRPQN